MKHQTHHDEHPHAKLSRDVIRLKRILVGIGTFVAVSLAALTAIMAVQTIYESARLTDIEHAAREKAAQNVGQAPAIQQSSSRHVVSTLGFTVDYDTDMFDAQATTNQDGPGFSGQQLTAPRSYESLTIARSSSSAGGEPLLSISTSARKNFWVERQRINPFLTNKIDALIDFVTAPLESDGATVSTPKNVMLGGVTYKQIDVTYDGSRYGIDTPVGDSYYVTVQNDRPYWIVLSNTSLDLSMKAALKSVIASMRYQRPQAELVGYVPTVTVARKTIELPKDTSNIPSSLDEDTLLDVVVRNQPAVVRILTRSCGDVVLRSHGATATLSHVCTGEVGSGSIVSSDGYIATNGHVVSLPPSAYIASVLQSETQLKKLFAYFVAAGIVSRNEADTFLKDVTSNDPRAKKTVAGIPGLIADNTVSINNPDVQYGVQLSNQPIRLSSSDRSIVFNDTVVSATLIGMDYDAANSNAALKGRGNFTHSDVALLKVGGSYPAVTLGSTEGLTVGDQLTAIGFPGYIDGNVATTQLQTIPTITQGSILGIQSDAPGSERQVIRTTVQIAQGNSGGPAFDDKGQQVGLNTYGAIACPDAKCFGNGTVRDIADLKRLLDDQHVTVKASSIQQDWNKALDSYTSGDYKTALELFEKTERAYPANYLAPELARDARKQLGSDTDTSGAGQAKMTLIMMLLAVLITGAILIAGIVFAVVHLNKKHAHLLPPSPPAPSI